MKHRIQWIAAVIMAASAGLASAGPGPYSCGCPSYGYTEKIVRIQPVQERVLESKCYIQQPLVIKRTTSVMGSSSRMSWNEPSSSEMVGNVVTAPFRLIGGGLAWTGRTLSGQPSVVAESSPRLEPVGERITTVRYLHSKPLLLPVGERITTTRFVSNRELLMPVREQITTVKTTKMTSHHKCGKKHISKTVTWSSPTLLPVGERITTTRFITSKPLLLPVGERTIIRTSRTFVSPWYSCD